MLVSYKKVLVAVDGSKEAEWAFKKAIDVCKRYHSELIITHVIDLKQFATIGAYQLNLTEESEKFGKELLKRYEQMAEESGIEDIDTLLEYGSPKIKIAKDIAPKHQVDLIICGATGLNAVERFLLGSVSENITRYAKCDVMVVRTEKDL
ncbi:universal stress protein [Bacillus timonensis]|uniref:Universal stress protein n=1 Tax=Bacillus timonensis TaxID=1033734 RepID=A0A4S3PXX8_9BACI|nr:universal stress protein [Bacillus timonensis]THE14757.1 universal stress protein [Bacillus timonensis]